jgi:hypothetical protein
MCRSITGKVLLASWLESLLFGEAHICYPFKKFFSGYCNEVVFVANLATIDSVG